MPDDPSEMLLARASKGDGSAIEGLLERHLPGLLAYVRLHAGALLTQRESCSDLVQSVCREVLEDMAGFEYRGEGQFRKWLFAKAASKIVDRHRYWLAEKRHPAVERRVADGDSSGDALSLPASFASPTAVAIGNEDLARLERVFADLPDDYRTVITLAKIVGLSHAEIANDLGRSEAAVRVLLHRALARVGWLIS